MWDWILRHLPETKPGTIEIRDIANLLVAGVGAVLAFIAIRLAKRQEDISRTQAAIAEKQDQIMQSQLARRSDLHVEGGLQDKNGTVITVKFHIINRGPKTADGLRWEIAYGEAVKPYVEFYHEDTGTVEGVWLGSTLGDMHCVEVINGDYEKKLFPGDRLEILRMRVDSNLKEMKEFSIAWRTRCEDGRVPEKGFATLKFGPGYGGFYNASDGELITS
jgi:hypothetical protein